MHAHLISWAAQACRQGTRWVGLGLLAGMALHAG
ncbi:MAG: hypothetical protein RI920_119, partial [Pseudomonadota bacterium]